MPTVKKFSTFGEHLRYIREISGRTLRDVSSNIGVDPSLLAKIERNERQPTKQLIKQVAVFLRLAKKSCKMNF
ncbi:MAG: helix-turn-helix transcriptional regulator [Crocinitomicaceae bacterium]|nr:helix-turn-helix transcriptional regulator [Crocinitomicaceae bacterium]